MKNQPFYRRLGYALHGLGYAIRTEKSVRVHVLATAVVAAVLIWRRPPAYWWAIGALTVAAVVVAELFNTALEHLADHLHPGQHEQIKLVKDLAAAAVLLTSFGALCVAGAFVYQQLA